jgi:hypothetical protein
MGPAMKGKANAKIEFASRRIGNRLIFVEPIDFDQGEWLSVEDKINDDSDRHYCDMLMRSLHKNSCPSKD